jgi:hypothetical protein
LLDEIQFGEQSIDFPIDLGNDSFMGDMIETISPVANGFLVMMNYSSLSLNNQLPESQPFIFTRAQNIEMTVASTKNQSTQLISEANLVFLGSHFYVPQAPEDNNGLFLPILPALFWIFAIGFYVASKKYPLPRTNETLDKKLKIYGLIIHIIMLVISFALLDLIISSYFGLSFITSLFNQSFYLITLGLLGFQLLLWTLGYICCSLPLHFIFKTLFRFIGVKKSGAALSKAISTLGIPLFAGFYVLLLINILLLFIDIPTLTFPL